MKHWRMLLFPLLLGAAGCVDVNYVGQTFPALPEDRSVTFFTQDMTVPRNEYRTIGRATLTAPGSTDSEELKEALIETARKHGADAVQVVEFKRVYVGDRLTPGGGNMQEPNASWTQEGRYPDGSYIYTDSFGEATRLEQPGTPVYDITVKALFLVTDARFAQVTAEVGKALSEAGIGGEKNLSAAAVDDQAVHQALERIPAAAETVPNAVEPAEKEVPPRKPLEIQLRNEPVAL